MKLARLEDYLKEYMLISLCKHIEENYEDDIIGECPNVKKWWDKHKEEVEEEEQLFNVKDVDDYNVEFCINEGKLENVKITIMLSTFERKTIEFKVDKSVGCYILTDDREDALGIALDWAMFFADEDGKKLAEHLLKNFDKINH